MSVRAVVLTIVGIFVTVLVLSIVMLTLDRRKLTPLNLAGDYEAEYSYPRMYLVKDRTIRLQLRADQTFQVVSELGKAEGIYSIDGTEVQLSVNQVDGKPMKAWPKLWIARCSRLIKQRYADTLAGTAVAGLPPAADLATFTTSFKSMYSMALQDPFATDIKLQIHQGGHELTDLTSFNNLIFLRSN